MSESTLTQGWTEITRAVSRALGYDTTYANLTATEIQELKDVLDMGCRQVCHPPPLPGERSSHSWSWLKPLLRIGLDANVSDYDLPDLFGGLIGNFAYDDPQAVLRYPPRETGIGHILARRQSQAATGPLSCAPELYAIYPGTTDGTTPTRWSLAVWPAPDQAYTLTGQYYINPSALSSSLTYPLGGEPHAELFRASCLAAAEQEMETTRGVQYAKFMERLAASVAWDRKTTGPMHFGYNGDRSQEMHRPYYRQHYSAAMPITYVPMS